MIKALAAAFALMASYSAVEAQQTRLPQFVEYCRLNPFECPVRGSRVIEWSEKLASDLMRVNLDVNSWMIPTPDPPGIDVWQSEVRNDDCDGAALTKRSRLRKLGYDVTALEPTVVNVSGQYHLILVVKTSQGDYALDNLTDHIRRVK